MKKVLILMFIITASLIFFKPSLVLATEGYQSWDGYPESPDTLAMYPYQTLAFMNYGTESAVLCLFENTNKIYRTVDQYDLRRLAPSGRIYKYTGGQWVYYAYGGLQLGTANESILQANYDIYSDVTLSTVYFAKNTIDLPTLVNGSPVWGRILYPETDGTETAKKTVTYKIDARIEGNKDHNIITFKMDGNPMTGTETVPGTDEYFIEGGGNVLSYKILNLREIQDDIYSYLTFDIRVSFNNITGLRSFYVNIVNYDSNTYVEAIRTVNLINFFDSNGDGMDDNTGEQVYANPSEYLGNEDLGGAPDHSQYEDTLFGNISFVIDSIEYFVSLPFKLIGSLFVQISKFIGTAATWFGDKTSGVIGFLTAIFSFLPPEVSIMIGGLLSFIVLFSVFKMIRG